MACHADIIARYFDVAMRRTSRANYGRSGNVYASGDILYSYGSHFELCRLIRDENGAPVLFLLNGDRYSVSTNRHQSEVRAAVSRIVDVPHVIIPFSALSAADVDLASVRLLDRTADRFVTTPHRSADLPDGATYRAESFSRYVDLTDAELQAIADAHNAERYNRWAADVANAWHVLGHEDGTARYFSDASADMWARRLLAAPPAPDAYTVDDIPMHARREWREIGKCVRLFLSRTSHVEITVTADGYTWETSRHWLGEALVTATTRERYTTRRLKNGEHRSRVIRPRKIKLLSGFDHNERRASYFLCELAPTDSVTIADAYESLKPETVRLAEMAGRAVRRQGDMFAIPMAISKRELTALGAEYRSGGMLHNTNHAATVVAYLPDGRQLARGTMRHVPAFRTPDHARITLADGKVWHLVVKNTVPLA